jgi:transposase
MLDWQCSTERKTYPRDVRDDEWALVAPYLTLMTTEAPQRAHSRREVFNGLRWMVRAGAAWRILPHAVPPWHTGYQQSHRWRKAGVCDAMVQDLRAVLRLAQGRQAAPCNRRPKMAHEQGMTGPNAGGARRGRWRWIP